MSNNLIVRCLLEKIFISNNKDELEKLRSSGSIDFGPLKYQDSSYSLYSLLMRASGENADASERKFRTIVEIILSEYCRAKGVMGPTNRIDGPLVFFGLVNNDAWKAISTVFYSFVEKFESTFENIADLYKHIKDDHKRINQNNEGRYKCQICDSASYKEKRYLARHIREKHRSGHPAPERVECEDCGGVYSRKYNLLRHQRAMGHGGQQKQSKITNRFSCTLCDKAFARKHILMQHMRRKHMPHQSDFVQPRGTNSHQEVSRASLVPYSDTSGSESDVSVHGQTSETGSDTDPDEPTSSRRVSRKRKANDDDDDQQGSQREKQSRIGSHDEEETEERWTACPEVDWNSIDEGDETVGGLIAMVHQRRRQNPHLRASELIREFRFTARARRLAANGKLEEIFYGVLRHLINRVPQGNGDRFMQVVLDAPQQLDYAIYGVVRPVNPKFHIDDFMERLMLVLSSRSELSLAHDFRLTIRTIILPPRMRGAGGMLLRKHCKTFLDYLLAKKSTWTAGGFGGVDCVVKCMFAGVEMKRFGLEAVRKLSWWKWKDLDRKLQITAEKLSLEMRLPLNRQICKWDYEKIQDYLNEKCEGLQLVVFQDLISGVQPEPWTGWSSKQSVTPDKDQIFLAIADQHCFLITDYPNFLGKRKMCPLCFKLYDKTVDHSCMRICCVCKQMECDAKKRTLSSFANTALKFCANCGVHFQTEKCYLNHIAYTACDMYQYHEACGAIVERATLLDGTHKEVCSVRKCADCGETYKEDLVVPHMCYITTAEPEKLGLPKKYRIIAFDFEATVNKETQQHLPYCVTAFRYCEKCDDPKFIELLKCDNCGVKRYKFFGRNARDEFFNWLFYKKENEGALAYSHNGSSYDTYMGLRYLLDNNIANPQVICNASRLLQLIAGKKVKLKDSFLMFGGSLRSLPTTFGFKSVASKGFFPHKLDAFKYLDYVGPPIDEKYYFTENMSETEYKDFRTHLSEQTEFNFRALSEGYCMEDTIVLALALQYFQRQCLQETNVAPLHHAMTLAQYCSLVFRSQMLDGGLIGRVPPNGYATPRNNSRLALKHLSWISKTKKIDIKTSMNGKEARIAGRPVDGLCVDPTGNLKEVYEVLGCFYHACFSVGCKIGYKQRPDFVHPLMQPMTNYEVYNRTMCQIRKMEDMGYKVYVIWEHEILEKLKTDPLYREHFDSQTDADFYTELDPRDALYGGRTESMALCKELSLEQQENGLRINYLDVVSLYPAKQLTTYLPCGHPEILTSYDLPNGGENMSREDLACYFGIARVTVEAPKQLRYPVLPHKNEEGKLCFALCRTCAQEKSNANCHHESKLRKITGTWVTTEIDMALQYGYQLVKVHRIWHYRKRCKNIFKKYVLHFLKGKLEASGIPSGYTRETLSDYQAKIKEIYGFDIDIAKIEYNPGKRLICKIMLNSLWGKFSQTLRRLCNLWTGDYNILAETLANPRFDIAHLEFSGDMSAFITYRQIEGSYDCSHALHSPVIASFVTSSARQYMYHFMDKLGDKLLYMDTDSFIFCSNENEEQPFPLGSFLGEFTSELGVNEWGVKFYSPGLKSYALVCNTGKIVTRCKGIKNDVVSKKLLNPALMKALVLGNVEEVIENYDQLEDRELKESLGLRTAMNADQGPLAYFPQRQIQKIKSQGILKTRTGLKAFRRTFDKRRVLANLTTLPFGYNDNDDSSSDE